MISAILREFERRRLRAFYRGWFAIASAAVGPLEVVGRVFKPQRPPPQRAQAAALICSPAERSNTVDFRTIGGNAKALLGYPTTYQILVAEEVSSEDCTVDRRYNSIFLKKAIVRPYRRHSLVFCLPTPPPSLSP